VTFAEGRYYFQALAGEYLIEGGRELGIAQCHGLRRDADAGSGHMQLPNEKGNDWDQDIQQGWVLGPSSYGFTQCTRTAKDFKKRSAWPAAN